MIALVARNDDERIELPKYIDTWLMDCANYRLSPIGHSTKDTNHLRRIIRRQPRRGLIQKQDARIAQQFHRNIDALALAAADNLAFRRANQPVADVIYSETGQDRVYSLVDPGFVRSVRSLAV